MLLEQRVDLFGFVDVRMRKTGLLVQSHHRKLDCATAHISTEPLPKRDQSSLFSELNVVESIVFPSTLQANSIASSTPISSL